MTPFIVVAINYHYDHLACSETSFESNTEKHFITKHVNYQPLISNLCYEIV